MNHNSELPLKAVKKGQLTSWKPLTPYKLEIFDGGCVSDDMQANCVPPLVVH